MNRMIYDLQINKLNYQLLDKAAEQCHTKKCPIRSVLDFLTQRDPLQPSLTIELKQTNRLGDMIHMSRHNSCGRYCERQVCVFCEVRITS